MSDERCEYGAVRFDPDAQANLHLLAQTDPAENGAYVVTPDLVATKATQPPPFA